MAGTMDAYGDEYNRKLVQQITTPLKEKEAVDIQQQKDIHSGSGGYGTGALLSSIGKRQAETGKQIESGATQVGLASAEAQTRDALTKAGWDFQSKEAEKVRKWDKLLTEMGYSHDEKMTKIRAEINKDLAKYNAQLQEEGQPNIWNEIVGGAVSAGTQFGLSKIPGLNRKTG